MNLEARGSPLQIQLWQLWDFDDLHLSLVGRVGKKAEGGVEEAVKMVNEEEIIVEEAKQWLEGRGQEDSTSHEIEYLSLCGIQVLQARKGWFLCNLKLHPRLADQNGNCHEGAIAIILDVVGSAVVTTYGGNIKVSVDFNISYFSTIKIQEEVEIEGKVVANKEKLSLTVVEMRRKEDGLLLASCKQWMAQINAGLTIRTRL